MTFQSHILLSLTPHGGLSSERGGCPPNGLKGLPGRDGGTGPPAQRHREVDVDVVSAASPVVINRGIDSAGSEEKNVGA